MTTFKCRNGDTLDALHAEKRKIEMEIADLQKKERVILDELAPIAAAISRASSRKLNIECRLNIWRAEFDARNRSRPPRMDEDGHCSRCGLEVRNYEGGTDAEAMEAHVCPPGFLDAVKQQTRKE